jgi:hypothetical protein
LNGNTARRSDAASARRTQATPARGFETGSSHISGKAAAVMAHEPEDLLHQAFDIYRAARLELEKWRTIRPDNLELDFYIEELKEALLDLKLATTNKDIGAIAEAIADVRLLLFELRFRSKGQV